VPKARWAALPVAVAKNINKYMLDELLVIVGAELILLVSIAAMSLYGRRMDVLSGRHFSSATDRAVSQGWNIGRLRRWVEHERKVHRLKKARGRTSNAGRLRPSATLSRDRTMETISRNRRRSVHPGQARDATRVMGWG
jgi:hypothetical protein